MKLFLAMLSGFVMTLVSFGGGVLFATTYIVSEPERAQVASLDAAEMWPSEPVVIEGPRAYRRVPARPVSPAAPKAPEGGEDTAPGIDRTTTASVESEADEAEAALEAELAALREEHVAWCHQRFRSYRAADNSYQPYEGGRRQCVSPFVKEYRTIVADAQSGGGEGTIVAAALSTGGQSSDAAPGGLTREHIQSCFDRYRSYRPEDNSYQPYGGGPRQQCR